MLKQLGKTLIVGLAMFASSAVMAGTFQCSINAGGFTSNSSTTSDPLNSKTILSLGPNAIVTHTGAAGTMTHYGISWWCETRVRFADNDAVTAYDLPLSGTCSPGTTAFNVPLTPLVTPIGTGATGILNVQVLETFNDSPSPDALWADGSTISVQYTGDTAAEGCTPVVVEPTTTCASEGYTGTKLEWCKNICERGYTGSTLAMWIRRWTDRYRTLPYCALEQPQQEG